MNFRHLRTFVIVADHGGFSRASARLNLTQSAASRQIQALEADLGVPLFDRVGRSVQLTSEGRTCFGAVAVCWQKPSHSANGRALSEPERPESSGWAPPHR